MKKRIIFDSDLTMGIPDCDIDDGLALLFVLGYEKEVPGSLLIEGLCTSYGNSDLETVYGNSQRICNDLSLSFPVLKGATDKNSAVSEAAHFLVEKANAHPGEISLCVTGSTTNLKGALTLDSQVLSKFREITFMGSITQSLVFNGKIMDELNFSCDPEATCLALATANHGANITVMTANNCLPAHFMPNEFERNLRTDEEDGGYLWRTCNPWFDTMKKHYGLDGFCCWDVLASAYLVEPELFIDQQSDVVLNQTLLKAGFLEPAFSGAPSARINTPPIADPGKFTTLCYHYWRRALT